jgi:hypothetical protein
MDRSRVKALATTLVAAAAFAGNVSAATVTMMFEGIAPSGLQVLGVTPYSEVRFTLTNFRSTLVKARWNQH